MNLARYFKNAFTFNDFIHKLGDNYQLHQIHYKKFILDEKGRGEIIKFRSINILALTEPWCGDSLAALPIIKKISEYGDNWQIKILLRDENLDLMDKFLTSGARAIPLFFFLDEHGEMLFKWGPRSKIAQHIFEKHRQMIQEGKMTKQEVIKKIRQFYARDRGKEIYRELMTLFKEYL